MFKDAKNLESVLAHLKECVEEHWFFEIGPDGAKELWEYIEYLQEVRKRD